MTLRTLRRRLWKKCFRRHEGNDSLSPINRANPSHLLWLSFYRFYFLFVARWHEQFNMKKNEASGYNSLTGSQPGRQARQVPTWPRKRRHLQFCLTKRFWLTNRVQAKTSMWTTGLDTHNVTEPHCSLPRYLQIMLCCKHLVWKEVKKKTCVKLYWQNTVRSGQTKWRQSVLRTTKCQNP